MLQMRRLLACLLSGLWLCWAAGSAVAQTGEAQFQRGLTLLEADQNEQAMLAFEAASEAGNKEAAWYLGRAYCYGQFGVTKSWQQASVYLERAAMLGHQRPPPLLFSMYTRGSCDSFADPWFSPKSFPGDEILEKCHATGGNPVCTMYLGVLVYRNGEATRGMGLVKTAQGLGAEDAGKYLRMMTPRGPSTANASTSSNRATNATRRQATDYSQFSVGQGWEAFEAGDYAKAYGIFRHHQKRGDADAYLGLGNMYELGHHVGRNPQTAMSMYEAAHNKGNILATFLYGYMIHSGQVWSSSDLRHQRVGIRYVRDAADAGVTAAQQYLADQAQIVARDNAEFQARLRALTTPCSDTYIRGETRDGRRYKVLRCD